jgi:hypothetical protein
MRPGAVATSCDARDWPALAALELKMRNKKLIRLHNCKITTILSLAPVPILTMSDGRFITSQKHR